MIVKVMLKNARKEMLVYDREQKHVVEGPAPKRVVDLMNGFDKAFFTAELRGTELALGARAPEQSW